MSALRRLLWLFALLFFIPAGFAQDKPVSLQNDYVRVPDICYPVLGERPESWNQALGAAVARYRTALLLENYQALRQESGLADRFAELARRGLEAQPGIPDAALIPDWVSFELSASEVLGVFARRKLRILDGKDLERLAGTQHSSRENFAELYLLTARAYLDQGEMHGFREQLGHLESYISQGGALKPIVIGYHCLSWQRTGKTEDLLASVRAVLEVGETYRFGQWPLADIFWVSSGDEVVELTRAVASRHRAAKGSERAALGEVLRALVVMNGRWAKELRGVEWFHLGYEELFDQLEAHQGGVSLSLTVEKLALLLLEGEATAKEQALPYLRSYIETLAERRKFVSDAHWLGIPASLYPPAPDLWSGSALERLDARAKVALWKLEPDAVRLPQLIDEVAALSPQDEALELTLDWAESLHSREPEAAARLLERARTLSKEFGFPVYELLLADMQRKLFARQGASRQAGAAAERVVALASELVTMTGPLRDGRSVGEIARQNADYLASQSLARGEAEKALSRLEQGQALQSAHQLSAGATRSGGEAGAVMRELRAVKSDEGVAARRQALGEANGTTLGKADFLKHSRELQQSYPELYDRTLSIKPMEFPRLQKHLPNDTVLLQYFPTETTLYIFAVTRQELVLEQVEIAREGLDHSLVDYLRLLRRVDRTARLTASSQELYRTLLEPVAAQLKTHPVVLLVPSGRLNYLPFASLLDGQSEPLGESHQISVLGKSSDLLDVLVGEVEAPGLASLVVLADPAGDLPAARKEGEALAALVPGGVGLYRDQATRDALAETLQGKQYLHLATHGEVDPVDPALNYLLLAGGEKLTGEDIFALPMEQVRMVTLSACNTALGVAEPTASVVSLAESFWVTGPDSVVATLWAVNDDSTALFMESFYDGLKRGAGKAEALQAAQRALRANPETNHPYFWSPFILLGDWR